VQFKHLRNTDTPCGEAMKETGLKQIVKEEKVVLMFSYYADAYAGEGAKYSHSASVNMNRLQDQGEVERRLWSALDAVRAEDNEGVARYAALGTPPGFSHAARTDKVPASVPRHVRAQQTDCRAERERERERRAPRTH
jgi:hypothetical protein